MKNSIIKLFETNINAGELLNQTFKLLNFDYKISNKVIIITINQKKNYL
jgi:hypothetical protein